MLIRADKEYIGACPTTVWLGLGQTTFVLQINTGRLFISLPIAVHFISKFVCLVRFVCVFYLYAHWCSSFSLKSFVTTSVRFNNLETSFSIPLVLLYLQSCCSQTASELSSRCIPRFHGFEPLSRRKLEFFRGKVETVNNIGSR